tara:strand:- start:19805 stop:20233 length:429 start_codon:yes stop_codon:yes gene_type:complete
MINLKETSVSMGLSRSSDGMVRLSISDAHSGDLMVETSITTSELGLLLTGMHGVKGDARVNLDCNVAKERTVESVNFEFTGNRSDSSMIDQVIYDFSMKYKDKGYSIQSDGTGSQQKINGVHTYSIKKYSEVENPFDVERHY